MHSRTQLLRASVAAGSAALLVAGAAYAAAPALAAGSVDSAPTIDAGDDRAEAAKAGSPTTCGKGKGGLGTGGEIFGKNPKNTYKDPDTAVSYDEGTFGATNLDILSIRAGYKLLGLVVAGQGGKSYNLYTVESLGERPAEGWLNLHAPVGKGGVPTPINHWFVCVQKG